MPREEISLEDFSNLLQPAIALAFDITEFGHLIAEEPKIHDNEALLYALLIFLSTSVILLLQVDGGKPQGKGGLIAWTLVGVFCLDAPFFVIRVYITTIFGVEDVGLVFLLKNLLAALFGLYRTASLVREIRKEKKDKELRRRVSSVRLPSDYVAKNYEAIEQFKDENGIEDNKEKDLWEKEEPQDEGETVIINVLPVISDVEETATVKDDEDEEKTDEEKAEVKEEKNDEKTDEEKAEVKEEKNEEVKDETKEETKVETGENIKEKTGGSDGEEDTTSE